MAFAPCTSNTDSADAGPCMGFGCNNAVTNHAALRHPCQQMKSFIKHNTSTVACHYRNVSALLLAKHIAMSETCCMAGILWGLTISI